ncbi:hypothetical protein PR048_001700 [Dryococelus australis]|uniref:Integrase zinc-binding domain-containing protein n=1 Tax=Dryococelus australis TaxID=614101 RepID=A0ABQ9II79_9NEOP|nr:hypothetical protein PR048_001700 [Dryococelus australis]
MELQVCSVIVNSIVTDAILLMLQQYMERDHELQSFCRIIRKLQKVPPELKQYWTYREDLSYAYGIVLKEILRSIHAAHQGLEKCIQRACGTIFWPRIISHISAFVENCEVYKEFQKSKYRQHHLHTQFQIELGRSRTSSCTISHMKFVFGWLGIPAVSNGMPECHVQIVKKTLKKSDSRSNIYITIALLEFHYTPGTRLLNFLWIAGLGAAFQNPSLPNHKEVSTVLLTKQTEQKAYYDVRAQQTSKEWVKVAVIIRPANHPCSYVVKMPSGNIVEHSTRVLLLGYCGENNLQNHF